MSQVQTAPSADGPPPVVAPVPTEVLEAELRALNPRHLLLCQGELRVWQVRASEAPWLMREIGRLRELTFRAIGEGTGRELDLDRYDGWYRHVVVWDAQRRRVIGAYRLGHTVEILPEHGIAGLYTSSLFDFDPALFERLGPSVEVGRSFVVPELQRSPVALGLLWRGIAAVLGNEPHQRKLFGPVSIDRLYQQGSIELMLGHLSAQHGNAALGALVRPRTPYDTSSAQAQLNLAAGAELPDIATLNRVVKAREGESRGIPVLLRHYLGLQAGILGFNVDPDFSDVIDALVLVDLDQVDGPRLQRFMGREGMARFHAARLAALDGERV